MRCLMVTTLAAPQTSNADYVALAVASLHALGIEYRRAMVEAVDAASASSGYDFILIPALNLTSYASLINDADLTIPVLGLQAAGGTSSYGSTPGVTGSASSLVDQFIASDFTTSSWLAANARFYTLSTGTAIMSAAATDSLSGSAQAQAGKVCVWRTTKGGAGNLYVSAVLGSTHPMLPFLVQAAIDNGDLAGPAPRRAPVMLSIDHINGLYSAADPGIIDSIASYVPAGGTIWATAQNSESSLFENMSAAVAAKLRAQHKSQGGPFRYCYHNHRPGEDAVSGSWPITAHGGTMAAAQTKAEQETNYDTDEVIWNGHGLVFDTPAYYAAGTDAWGEETLPLFSEDRSVASDGGEAVTQAGKGFRAFRMALGSTRRRNEPLNTLVFNAHRRRRTVCGIQLFPALDLSTNADLPFDSIVDWRVLFQRLGLALSCGLNVYMHDEDFSAPQAPGEVDSQHGAEVAGMLRDFASTLGDVADVFADPLHYVMPRHSGGVDGVQY